MNEVHEQLDRIERTLDRLSEQVHKLELRQVTDTAMARARLDELARVVGWIDRATRPGKH